MLYEVAIYLTWSNGSGLWKTRYFKTKEVAKNLKSKSIHKKKCEYGLRRFVTEYTDKGIPTYVPPPPVIKPKRTSKKKKS